MDEQPVTSETSPEIKSVAVMGTGQIATGIALCCALSKVPISLIGLNSGELVTARDWITDFLQKGVEKDKFKQADVYEIASRLCFAVSLDPVRRADLIIECCANDRESKLHFFNEIAKDVKSTAIVATHTSSMEIREFGVALGCPDRFIGTHFFHPVPIMKLVEIVLTPDTSKDAMEMVLDFCAKIGKQTVLCKDQPGLFVNRLLIPFLLRAMRLYEQGNAPEDVDLAIELGLGHKMGPLKLADSLGLDTVAKMAELLYQHYGDECFLAPSVLKNMIERGRLGRKTKHGFYVY